MSGGSSAYAGASPPPWPLPSGTWARRRTGTLTGPGTCRDPARMLHHYVSRDQWGEPYVRRSKLKVSLKAQRRGVLNDELQGVDRNSMRALRPVAHLDSCH